MTKRKLRGLKREKDEVEEEVEKEEEEEELFDEEEEEELEEEEERTNHQLNIAEKKALLKEAKKRDGRDWKLHMPKIESGLDWDALRFRLH